MSKAGKQAKIAEDTRLRAINEGVGQVNAIFGAGREAQYGDYLAALRDRGNADLNEQQSLVDRQSKFSLARRGVIGGSSEIDTRRRNRKRYIQALIGNESRAQSAVGRLRQSDENSRQNLINMIFGGMDASTGAQRASMAMRGNLASAQSDFIPNTIDSAIGAGAGAYTQGLQRDAYSQGGRAAREALYAG